MKTKTVVLAMAVVLCMAVNAWAEGSYKIGVLAKNGPVKAMEMWQATGEYLTETVDGMTFEIVPLDFGEVHSAIEQGNVDFFLVNSSMFVTAKVQYGAEPIATMVNSRQGKPLHSFGGVILATADNDSIDSIEDLRGKTFLAVEKSSFGGWQMAYKVFLDAGIDPFTELQKLEFVGKHENVVLAVQNGTVDAGTVRTDTLERMAAEGTIDMEEFKIIHPMEHAGFPFVCSTTLYPEWPLAKVKQTPDHVADAMVAALKKLDKDHQAAKNSKVVGWVDCLDYAPVEDLQKTLKIGAYEGESQTAAAAQ